MYLNVTTMLVFWKTIKDLSNRKNGEINDKNHSFQYFQTILRCMICVKLTSHQSIPQLENCPACMYIVKKRGS